MKVDSIKNDCIFFSSWHGPALCKSDKLCYSNTAQRITPYPDFLPTDVASCVYKAASLADVNMETLI